MTPLYLHNGKILVVDGALASNEACCCGDCQCSMFYGVAIAWGSGDPDVCDAYRSNIDTIAESYQAAGWTVTVQDWFGDPPMEGACGTIFLFICPTCDWPAEWPYDENPPDPENWYGVSYNTNQGDQIPYFPHAQICGGTITLGGEGDPPFVIDGIITQDALGNIINKRYETVYTSYPYLSGIQWIRRCGPPTSCVGSACDGDSACEPNCDCLNDLPLSFTACIGSGAAGTATFQGGVITSTNITNGGGGYARLGRVQPTVTASVSGGIGAELLVNLEQVTPNDACQPTYWRVASVSVTNGGSGYADATSLTFSSDSGDPGQSHAVASAFVGVDEPNPLVYVVSNAGVSAILTPVWSVVASPTNPPERAGQVCGLPARTAYSVTSFTITDGGAGYEVGDFVLIEFDTTSDGVVSVGVDATVSAVSETGEITAITVNSGGEFGGSFTDEIVEVVLQTCPVAAVGNYFMESSSAVPYVASVTVGVPGNAILTAVVGSDPATPSTFGKITGVTITDGGSGYLGVCEGNPLP